MGLVLPITCGICQQKFTAPAVTELVAAGDAKLFTTQSGEPCTGTERLGEILEALVNHIKEAHKPAYQVGMIESAQLLRLLCLMTYQTEDKGAIQLRDFMRYSFWQKFQRNRPATDDEVAQIINQSGLTTRDRPKMIELLKQCRDIWCEQGKFAPQPLMPPKPPTNGKAVLVKP